jgi:DNA processing protein
VLNDIKKLKNPPQCLNIVGKLKKEDEKSIVVVGTRTMSNYGKDVINYFVPRLVEAGYTIVSGLALGCDSYAMQVTLRCGGRTIGVLGYGINRIGKDYNSRFIRYVCDHPNGVVVSPFSRDMHPKKYTFIYRNSIMAAIGKSVLVVEAKAKSGVYYTVNAALDLGKEIYAVPGSIFCYNSVGTNGLIKEGAQLVRNITDVLA